MIQMQFFNQQIDKLRGLYPQSYNPEKIKVIWEIVKDLQPSSLEKIVRNFLINTRTAPMPVDFKEQTEIERRSQRLSLPMPSSFTDSKVFDEQERKEIFNIMKQTAMGRISAEDASKFAESIGEALNSGGVKPAAFKKQNPITGDWEK